jgi:hypothetical protein
MRGKVSETKLDQNSKVIFNQAGESYTLLIQLARFYVRLVDKL